MNKKFIFLFLIFFLAASAIAQEETTKPGLTPDSPFYFLDTWGEKIGLFFTSGPEAKAKKALGYAEEKIAEAKIMAEMGKEKALERAVYEYDKLLENATEKIKGLKDQKKEEIREKLINLITESTLRHQEVLVGVLEKAPEQAKKGIKKAIEASQNGFEAAINAVSETEKKGIINKTKEIKSQIEQRWKESLDETE